jgi:hypothetical protein
MGLEKQNLFALESKNLGTKNKGGSKERSKEEGR